MKTVVKLKMVTLIALVACSISSFAQVPTMYVMKNGEVIFEFPVSDIDNVTFDEIVSDDALFVHKNDDPSVDKNLLSNIQQLSFSDENLSVEMLTENKVYIFEDIAKLLFEDINTTGINNPSTQNSLDVLVSVAPTGDVIVNSPVAIKLLTLLSIDGKMISKQQCNGAETQYLISLQNNTAGVYLLRIETEQGTIVKKVIKSLSK